MPKTPGKRRRRGRWIALVVVVVLLGAAFGVGRYYFSGRRLAHFVEKMVFGNIRGKVTIGSIDWPIWGVFRRRVPAVATDVNVLDEHGDVIIHIPRLTGTIDWPALVFRGTHDLIIDDAVIEGGEAWIREYATPGGPEATAVNLITAMKPRVVMHPRPGRHLPPGPIIEVHSLKLTDVELELAFKGWGLTLHRVRTPGALRLSLRNMDSRVLDFTYALAPESESGLLVIGPQRFELENLKAFRFGQYPEEPDALVLDVMARTVGGTQVQLLGKLQKIYDLAVANHLVHVTLDVRRAGSVLGQLTHAVLDGGWARLKVDGPLVAPLLRIDARGLRVLNPVAAVDVDHVVGSLDLASQSAAVDELTLRVLGGRASLQGRGNLLARAVTELSLEITQPINLQTFLPPDVVRAAQGSRLSGHLRLRGLAPRALIVDRLKLELGQAHVEKGWVRLLGDEVTTAGLEVTLADATAQVRGSLHPRTRAVAVDFDAVAQRAKAILARFGLPALFDAATARGRVTGTLDAMVVSADARFGGVPLVPQLDASVTYRTADRRLDLHRVLGDPFGGHVNATASMIVGPHLRLLESDLQATGLDLARIPGTAGLLGGSVGLSTRLYGTLARPGGQLLLEAGGVTFGGARVGDVRVQAAAEGATLSIARLRIGGQGGGVLGALDISGKVGLDPDHTLALDVALDGLPLDRVPRLVLDALYPGDPRPGAKLATLDLTGLANLHARVGGSLSSPTVSGQLSLLGFGALASLLGAAEIDLEPWPSSRLHFRGKLFQDQLAVDGSLALSASALKAPLDLKVRVSFTKVELDQLFPDLFAKIDAHGWVTGWVDLTTAPTLRAELHVTRTRLNLETTDPRALAVENKGEIVIAYDGETGRATLLQPLRVGSADSELVVEGSASPTQLALKVTGGLQLSVLEFYTKRWVDSVRGDLRLDVMVTGSPARPVVAGKVALANVAVQAPEKETPLLVPSGTILVGERRINVDPADPLVVEMEGHRLVIGAAQPGRTTPTCALTLEAGFRPVDVDCRVDGRVAGKLLEIVAPRVFTSAGGSAQASLTLRGPVASPALGGAVVLDEPLTLTPRSFRREITLRSGSVRFENDKLTIDHVTGTIDEGHLSVQGSADVADYQLTSASLRLDVDGFIQRIPEVLELELAAGLDAKYARGRLSVGGDLKIIAGRYVQKFDIPDQIKPKRSSGARGEPFWAGQPLLAHMALDLHVRTSGTGVFTVSNNLAQLALDGAVDITGTPERPVFSGQAYALEGGTLKLPGTKIHEFALKTGDIAFDPFRTFPTTTPYVSLKAEAPFIDLEQTEHVVSLAFTGTLTEFQWDLSTNTGLNRFQTIALIMLGRTTDELRARARGDATSSGLGQTAAGAQYAAVAGGTNPLITASDELLKNVTGDFISVLLSDPLKNLLGVDEIKFGVGTESVQLSLKWKVRPNLTFNGDYEQGFRSWSRTKASMNYEFADDWFAVAQYFRLNSTQDFSQLQNESSLQLQLKYKFVIP